MNTPAQLTLRMTPEEFARLKDAHAATFGAHRLSFNKWILAIIEKGLTS